MTDNSKIVILHHDYVTALNGDIRENIESSKDLLKKIDKKDPSLQQILKQKAQNQKTLEDLELRSLLGGLIYGPSNREGLAYSDNKNEALIELARLEFLGDLPKL
ncbi:hypothetical protein TrLO_g10330 [Triparma laevis f. longispina]|uniref:Uncharacterized protein n=1 Tax=Triparma laevis f. longispina TaxID=1714387 RepID=A0A9W7DVD1_9STRA|nr:hypothetical protein TrLO_g10330 [Triparma laevis f. longispina]